MSLEAAADAPFPEQHHASLLDRLLGWIEKAGNKVPHPAIIFLS